MTSPSGLAIRAFRRQREYRPIPWASRAGRLSNATLTGAHHRISGGLAFFGALGESVRSQSFADRSHPERSQVGWLYINQDAIVRGPQTRVAAGERAWRRHRRG